MIDNQIFLTNNQFFVTNKDTIIINTFPKIYIFKNMSRHSITLLFAFLIFVVSQTNKQPEPLLAMINIGEKVTSAFSKINQYTNLHAITIGKVEKKYLFFYFKVDRIYDHLNFVINVTTN